MKNRKLLLIVSLVLALTMSLGGTLAYLTDTDADVNVMTVGRVEIKQNEQKRDGTAFEQNQQLLPIVGSISQKDANGYVSAANYIDKIVTVTNTGSTEAWVRTLIAVPQLTYTAQGETPNASENVLHWNGYCFGDTADKYPAAVRLPGSGKAVANNWWWGKETESQWPGNAEGWNTYDIEIGDLDYTVYVVTNVAKVASEETTAPNMVGLYLDERVDYDNDSENYTITVNNKEYAIEGLDETVEILVLSQAVQAGGFGNAWDAFEAAFPLTEETAKTTLEGWFDKDEMKQDTTGTNNVPPVFADVTVSNTAELSAALAKVNAGESVVIKLNDGTYESPENGDGKIITLMGSKNAIVQVKIDNDNYDCSDYGYEGTTLKLSGITLKVGGEGAGNYQGYGRTVLELNDCTVQGTLWACEDATFNDCTFEIEGNAYNIWTWGASTAEFNNCTFNSDGKALLVYGERDNKVTLNNCVFNDNGGLTDMKAAIEIGSHANCKREVIVNNTTVNGYEINDEGTDTGTTLWGNKNAMSNELLNVVVDGVDVY